MKTKRKRNRRIIKILSDDEGMLPCRQRQALSKHLLRSHVNITPMCVVSRLCFILSIKREKIKGRKKKCVVEHSVQFRTHPLPRQIKSPEVRVADARIHNAQHWRYNTFYWLLAKVGMARRWIQLSLQSKRQNPLPARFQ